MPNYNNQSSLLKSPPKLDKSRTQTESKPLDPSFIRDLFEGLVDIPMGALGIGPDTKANRVGALLGMALPIGSKLSGLNKPKLGRYPEVDVSSQIPIQNKLAMGISPSSGIYDEAGRYLGPASKIDPAYEAHIASSRNKFPANKFRIESPETSFVNKGDTSGVSPSSAAINELYKRYLNRGSER